MAITLDVTQKPELSIIETVGGVAPAGVDNGEYSHNLVSNGKLTGTTSPAATQVWTGRVTLSGGTGSLDLTALPYTVDREDLDLTTLKVLAVKLVAPGTNTVAIKVEGAVTNPYELFGDADTEIDVGVGEYVVKGVLDPNGAVLAAVSSTVKALLFTGTGTEILDITIVAGT